MRLTRSEINPIYWIVTIGNSKSIKPLPHVTVRIEVDDGPGDDAALRREIVSMIVAAVNKGDDDEL